MNEDRIDAAARALWKDYLTTKRRPHPRLSHGLEHVERRHIASQALDIVAWRVGDGPATLLVHGIADDHTVWAPMMREMTARGLPFVVIDLPAHGFSSGDEIALPPMSQAIRDVAAACGPISAIVGHSLGGLTAGLAITDGLKVESAILIGVTRQRKRRMLRLAEERGDGAAVLERAMALHADRFGPADIDISLTAIGADITVPTLLIHSIDDERVAFADSEAAHTVIPNSELWLPAGPNHRNSARDPVVIDRMLQFLQTHTA